MYAIRSYYAHGLALLDLRVRGRENRGTQEEGRNRACRPLLGRGRITSYNVCYTKLLRFQAGNAIAALKAKLALKARVKRAGKFV